MTRRISRSTERLPYERGIEPLVDDLDVYPGCLFASSFEYPGRYTRFDIGFCRPPLMLTAVGRRFELRVLNERGRVPLAAVAERLEDHAHVADLRREPAHDGRFGYERIDGLDLRRYAHLLRPGDLILVEGNTRFSMIVKYLTQSTWSHIVMYVGRFLPDETPLPLEQGQLDYLDELRGLVQVPADCRLLRGASEVQTVVEASTEYDLVVLGAAAEKRFLGGFRGTLQDKLDERGACSVLRLRRPRTRAHDDEVVGKRMEPYGAGFDLAHFLDDRFVAAHLPRAKKEALDFIGDELQFIDVIDPPMISPGANDAVKLGTEAMNAFNLMAKGLRKDLKGFRKLDAEDAIDPENPVGESFSEKLTGRLRYMAPGGRFWAQWDVRYSGEQMSVELGTNPLGDVIPSYTVQNLREGDSSREALDGLDLEVYDGPHGEEGCGSGGCGSGGGCGGGGGCGTGAGCASTGGGGVVASSMSAMARGTTADDPRRTRSAARSRSCAV